MAAIGLVILLILDSIRRFLAGSIEATDATDML